MGRNSRRVHGQDRSSHQQDQRDFRMTCPTGDYRKIETRTMTVGGTYAIHLAIQRIHTHGGNVCAIGVTPIWGPDGNEICERYVIVYQSTEPVPEPEVDW